MLGCFAVTTVQASEIAAAPTRDTVEVMVCAPVWGQYHYRVPPRFAARAQVGARVLVRFGGKSDRRDRARLAPRHRPRSRS